MTSVSDRAPLFVDSMALNQWLLQKFDQTPGVLGPSLCRCALILIQAIALALRDRHQEEQIDLADEQLIRLRVLLRLAADGGRLNNAQYVYALDKVDAIGRQLGGWRRSLGPV